MTGATIERPLANENKSLGKFELGGIRPAPRGVPQIEVTFDIDADGILKVSAKDRDTGQETAITIAGSTGLNDDEVNEMIAAAQAAGLDVSINRVGSMLTVFLTKVPVTDLTSATTSNTARFSRWFHGMLNRGVYLPCSQFEAMFVSAVHTDTDLEQTIAAADASFRDCRD